MKIRGIVAQGKKEANPIRWKGQSYIEFDLQMAQQQMQMDYELNRQKMRHQVALGQSQRYIDQMQAGLQNGIYGVSSAVGNILGNED